MAETRRREHGEVEEAIAAFRRNLMEAMKTGHWMAACWKVNEDGTTELAGCTTWQWPDDNFDDATSSLKKEIAERSGPAAGENDPLPVADFMKEIEAQAKDGPPKEEGK